MSRKGGNATPGQASTVPSITPALQTMCALLAATLDPVVVGETLEAYSELKSNHYLGGHRLSAVEAGRFSEAVLRLCQQIATGSFTPLADRLTVEKVIKQLENASGAPDSVRFHIPRALRVVYDIRSKRDAAHLNDGIDPNVQDSALVASTCDWVLAELVRLRHGADPRAAAMLVEDLVTRRAPAVQDFDGFLKVLDASLSAGDHLLLLLHQRGPQGATVSELEEWSRPDMRANLRRTLNRLVHDKLWAHNAEGRIYITQTGQKEVARRGLGQPL